MQGIACQVWSAKNSLARFLISEFGLKRDVLIFPVMAWFTFGGIPRSTDFLGLGIVLVGVMVSLRKSN
jgi:hypothetical protein